MISTRRALVLAAVLGALSGCRAHVSPSDACANHNEGCRTEACTEKTWLKRWCGEGPDPLPVARALPRMPMGCDSATPASWGSTLPASSPEMAAHQAYCGLLASLRDDVCPPQVEEYSTGKTGCPRFRSMRMTRVAKALLAASDRMAAAARKEHAKPTRAPECEVGAAGASSAGRATESESYCRLLAAVDAHPCPVEVTELRGGDGCTLYRSQLLNRFATALFEEAFHLGRAAATSPF